MILASENQVTGFQRIVRRINSGQKFWKRRTARDFVALNVANIKPQGPYIRNYQSEYFEHFSKYLYSKY